MVKLLGQVYVVYAKHSNWLVKLASAFAVAFGGITGLKWGATRLFLWLCGSPRPSTQVRLKILDKTLEFNKLSWQKKCLFFSQELTGMAFWETALPKMVIRTQNCVVSLTKP